MNILFLSLGEFSDFSGGSVHIDILKRLSRDHQVYLVCKSERRNNLPTRLETQDGIRVLRVLTGNLKNVGLIEKGISTLTVEYRFLSAVKRYFSDVKFDLVLYETPPITFVSVVKKIKKRDRARSYLMLKDIFPQNAVDLGMMTTRGIKGLIWRYFRKKEKKLYAVSDRIGCMSEANAAYVLKHNPEIPPEKVEVCPNCMAFTDKRVTAEERRTMREKYGLPQDKTVLIYGGNLGKPQGIPFLIECLRAKANDPDAYFMIVGNGTEYGAIERFLQTEKPANVKLMQSLPRADYDQLVAACDVGLIFLDHRFTIPNFPSRILSYMQAGLPVLCCTDPNTDIGTVAVQGGFGWWCESNDTAAFSRLVSEAAHADLPAMKAAAQNYLKENYTVETAYARIVD